MKFNLKTFSKNSNELQIISAQSKPDLKLFAQLMSDIDNEPEEILKALVPMSNYSEFYLGYLNETLIGRAQFFIDSSKIAGVYKVHVNENFRNKGFGMNLVGHCMQNAKEKGATSVVLAATDSGEHLYKKMHFSYLSQHYYVSGMTS